MPRPRLDGRLAADREHAARRRSANRSTGPAWVTPGVSCESKYVAVQRYSSHGRSGTTWRCTAVPRLQSFTGLTEKAFATAHLRISDWLTRLGSPKSLATPPDNV